MKNIASAVMRQAQESDVAGLNAFARQSFADTFGHLYREEDLSAFLRENYIDEKLRDQIRSGEYYVHVVECDTHIAGYVKAGRCRLPAPDMPAHAYEIHQLYVDKALQGCGIGSCLLKDAIAWCREQRTDTLYIGVWENNEGAQRLYRRAGFEVVGEYLFHVGRHADRELIMRWQAV